MNSTERRVFELDVDIDADAFTISNGELLAAIAEEVDLETVTNHELRDIFSFVGRRIIHLNWRDLVRHAIKHLPFGLNQTSIAWEGHYPCTGCPDAMMEVSHCYHQQECKAWEIFESRI